MNSVDVQWTAAIERAIKISAVTTIQTSIGNFTFINVDITSTSSVIFWAITFESTIIVMTYPIMHTEIRICALIYVIFTPRPMITSGARTCVGSKRILTFMKTIARFFCFTFINVFRAIITCKTGIAFAHVTSKCIYARSTILTWIRGYQSTFINIFITVASCVFGLTFTGVTADSINANCTIHTWMASLAFVNVKFAVRSWEIFWACTIVASRCIRTISPKTRIRRAFIYIFITVPPTVSSSSTIACIISFCVDARGTMLAEGTFVCQAFIYVFLASYSTPTWRNKNKKSMQRQE